MKMNERESEARAKQEAGKTLLNLGKEAAGSQADEPSTCEDMSTVGRG